jgi:hypothetical protein
MLDYIFWHQPYRRLMVKICGLIKGRLHYWMLDRLYPGDCYISFEE